MSVGIGVADILKVIQLSKLTIENCRSAPADFGEASRLCESLYVLLTGVKEEYEKPDSPLHKNERNCTDFAIHLKACETAAKPLAEYVAKFSSLGGSSKRLVDRFRFSKKQFLELRGNLAYYTGNLSHFLNSVELGALGRVDTNVQQIKDYLPQLMLKVDQMCAEVRIMGERESVLSDHTDDEKFVWRAFRRELIRAGFTSRVLREHEAAIFLRIRELTEYGLLESDASTRASSYLGGVSNFSDYEAPRATEAPRFQATCESESGAESERTVTPRPSNRTLRSYTFPEPNKTRTSPKLSKIRSNEMPPHHELHTEKISDELEDVVRAHSVSAWMETGIHIAGNLDDEQSKKSPSAPIRIWGNRSGSAIFKARFVSTDGEFILFRDHDNEEVKIPLSNLADADLEFISSEETKRFPEGEGAQSYRQVNAQDTARSNVRNISSSGASNGPASCEAHETTPIIDHHQRPVQWQYRTQVELPTRSDQDYRPYAGGSPLPAAAGEGNLGRVEELVSDGEHIESRAWLLGLNATALFKAASAGHLPVAKFLLENGANPDTQSSSEVPVLFEAIYKDNPHIVRLLLEYEAEQEGCIYEKPRKGEKTIQTKSDTTALHVASMYGARRSIVPLLDYGANLEACDEQGRTPLLLAVLYGEFSTARVLLQHGAKCNVTLPEGPSPLYMAVNSRALEMARSLLQAGADPLVGKHRIGTPIINCAIMNRDSEMVRLLLDHGVDPNAKSSFHVSHYRDFRERIMHGVFAGMFGRKGLNSRFSALHTATLLSSKDVVEVLVEKGANVNAQESRYGLTSLNLAAIRLEASRLYGKAPFIQSCEELVEFLITHGAKRKSQLERSASPSPVESESETGSALSKTGLRRRSSKLDKHATSDALVGLVASLTKGMFRSNKNEKP